jgi:hypothetical protein
MKPIIPAPAVLALLAVLVFPPSAARAWGGGGATLKVSELVVKVEGESTLHAWSLSASSVSVTAVASEDGAGVLAAVGHNGLKSLVLVLGVDSLKSNEGGGMDKNTRRALGSDKFPAIRFSMKSYRLSGLAATVQGDLSIHGRTKPVTLTGLLAPEGHALTVKGSYPLLMSDYGVKPPVVMFMKAANKVKIVFGFKLSE